jgi:hypothetical protein
VIANWFIDFRIKRYQVNEGAINLRIRKRRDEIAASKEDYCLAQPKKFRELIKDMYKGFPNLRVHEDRIKEVVITEEDRTALVDHGFFIRELHSSGGKEYYEYALGPNSLNLISAWKTEELNETIIKMNVAVVLLASLTVFVSIVNALRTITDPFLNGFVVFGEVSLIAIMIYVFLLFKLGNIK